jgi:hypothetical protein
MTHKYKIPKEALKYTIAKDIRENHIKGLIYILIQDDHLIISTTETTSKEDISKLFLKEGFKLLDFQIREKKEIQWD